MPIGPLVKRIFETDVKGVKQIIEKTWLEALEKEDKLQRKAAQRLVDWYNRDRTEILAHLKTASEKTFDTEIKTMWHFPLINGVPRTISRLSQMYRNPPERLLSRKGKLIDKKDQATYEHLDRLYGSFNPDARLKDADRYSTLLNTVHIEVVPRNGAIDWDIRLRPTTTVLQDPENFLGFSKIAYYTEMMDPTDLKLYKGWVYWTEDEHYFLEESGRYAFGMSDESGSNPYNPIIPVVCIRKTDPQDDYWGILGADLVDGFEHANLQLANLWENGFLQTHGQAIAINLGLKRGQTFKTGPRNPYAVDDVSKDDVEPTIKFVKPDADLKETMDLIDWFIKSIGAAHGLPPSAWSMDETRMSGIAKYLDNLELLEVREDETSMWERIEAELFDKSRMVYNQWASGNGVKPIPEALELEAKFPETQFPESPTERSARLALDFIANIDSPIELRIREQGETRKEATDKVLQIAEDNKLVREAGAPPDPFGGQVPDKKEPEENDEENEE